MTDALKMYEGVLFELNQYESPEFDVGDFNHYINQAMELVILEELASFELTQIVSDNLSPLIAFTAEDPFFSFNPTNATDVREKDKPADYRHVVSCLTTIRYKVATASFAVNNTRTETTKRLSGDSWASILTNRYFRPLVSDSDMRLYHRVTGNKISILFDTPAYPNNDIVIESVNMEYIRQPEAIKLSNVYAIDQDTPFSPAVNRKIVKLCAQLFLNPQSQVAPENVPANN